jgi:hypothetical protein
MWCQHCRQDVPGVASATSFGLNCVRCGNRFPVHFTSHSGNDASTSTEQQERQLRQTRDAVAAAEIAADIDDWALDLEMQRMRHIVQAAAHDPLPMARQQALASLGDTTAMNNAMNKFASSAEQFHAEPFHRVDAASIGRHSLKQHPHVAPPQGKHNGQFRLSTAAWCLLSLGLTTFICGGVLLGWSLLAHRTHLWTFGMPIALGGQFSLLLGLVLRQDLLGIATRRTADQLGAIDERLDERLDDLKRTTAVASATQNAPSQAFYTHMAQGANPQMLLADLKGQVDLLAVQMATSR